MPFTKTTLVASMRPVAGWQRQTARLWVTRTWRLLAAFGLPLAGVIGRERGNDPYKPSNVVSFNWGPLGSFPHSLLSSETWGVPDFGKAPV